MVEGRGQWYRTYVTYSTYLPRTIDYRWKMTGLNQTKGERIVCPFAFHTDKLSVPLTLHRRKKLGVRLCLLQTLEHDFHLLNRRQRIQDAPHYPDAIQVFLADE